MEAVRQRLTGDSALARFGQRQVHGLTGATNANGLHGLGMDSDERASALTALKGATPEASRWEQFRKHTPEMVAARHAGDISDAQKSLSAARKAEAMGLTSIPGIAKSLATNGVGETFRGAIGHQLHGAGNAQKALMAAGVGGSVYSAAKPVEGETGGQHAARAGKGLLSAGAGLLTGGLPILPGMVAGSLLPQHKVQA